ncbi:hypothetical protein NPIL_5401 [Nephila pilipes]|uniref:Uncharacterized protein n=1 Tax=Nephila pilipes TaxID=299642 RepID=A0A8X6NVA5_NEPPI|nr:hypothetical protein NPIL_5401 [Nephila pilipes]
MVWDVSSKWDGMFRHLPTVPMIVEIGLTRSLGNLTGTGEGRNHSRIFCWMLMVTSSARFPSDGKDSMFGLLF